MADRTKTIYPYGLDKKFHLKFRIDSRVRQNSPAVTLAEISQEKNSNLNNLNKFPNIS